MAKRGYRGKHPHNDMKVPKDVSSQKYNPKLKTQYDKLKNDKTRYDFIRTNYFYPQATLTISGTLDLVAASHLTMSATDGTELILLGIDGPTTASAGRFKANGTAADASDGIVLCVNTGLSGKITASQTGGTVTLKQVEPGPDGNTVFNFGECEENVSINGVTAKNSGSATFKFTGG